MKLLLLLFLTVFTLSAQEESLNCHYNLQEALFYLKGNTSIEPDTSKAISYLKPCVSIKDINAQLVLGHIYTNDSVEKTVKKGFNLIKKSAKQDNPIATQKLGVLYKYGTGCKLNYKKAMKQFEKAYELGHDEGAYSMGYFHFKGLGDVPQNYTKAVYWFEKSNSEMAKYWLGVCYLNGYGVTKNLSKANEFLGTNFEYTLPTKDTSEPLGDSSTSVIDNTQIPLDNLVETISEKQLIATWKGQLFKKDWSANNIEVSFPASLILNYNTETEALEYRWEMAEQSVTGTAYFIDNALYFDQLYINLPHESYNEKIPQSLDYHLLSSDLSLLSFNNQNVLSGTVESYIPDWDEKGFPLEFVLVKEQSSSEADTEISAEILQALATQTQHFIKLYPNPFEEDLVIAYTLDEGAKTKIEVNSFDGLQHFTVLEEQSQNPGDYRYHFENTSLKKGIYVVNIYVNGAKKTRLIIKK